MVATTMPSTPSLVHKLTQAFPQFQFVKGDEFLWQPEDQTVYYAGGDHAEALLLHELSHGLLGHNGYARDIELLAMESAAWDKAYSLAPSYGVAITEAVAESHLDTYREWLHARSTCPQCTAIGFQTSSHDYECPACTQTWHVNEAKICALRRYAH